MMQQMFLGFGAAVKTYVDDVFSTYVYEGNNGTQSINNGIDLSGKGGLVWHKHRSGTYNGPIMFDTERFVSSGDNNGLDTSSTGVPGDFSGFNSINNNGFTVQHYAGNLFNASSNNYVSWAFRKAEGFFDVVTYSGNSTAGRTVAHSLGSVPGMILIKILNDSKDWHVYHRSLGATKNLRLNESDAVRTQTNIFNDTEPTSTHFTLGSEADVNGTGKNFVAYIFAHDDQSFGTDSDEAIIKCGTYNGSSGTQTINLGFEPQWLLIKRSDSGDNWRMLDVMREMSASDARYINADTTVAEGNYGSAWVSASSTGFTLYGSDGSTNRSGGTYVYMAIRRPHKPPESATEVFAIDTKVGTSPTPPTYYSGFPVDWSLKRDHTATHNWQARARLTGTEESYVDLTNAASIQASTTVTFDQMNGVGTNTGVDTASHNWMFKRAPGFFDVVAYTGEGGNNRSVAHNLTVTPELWITKKRSATGGWFANYTVVDGTWDYLRLDHNGSVGGVGASFTLPTSTAFFVDSSEAGASDVSGVTYIAYLFATLPGISKVGSYSGSNSAQNIDCGFTASARFVLIKRTDSAVDWFVFDTTRGTVRGNDSFLKLNTNAAQTGGDDYIDPYATGFTINGTYSGLNASGGTYLFLAIA